MEENNFQQPEQNIHQKAQTQEAQQPSVHIPQGTQQVAQEKINKPWKILTYVSLSVSLLVFGVLGLWFYQEKIVKKPTPPTMPTTVPTPISPTPTSTSVFTIPADWKTYRNEGCGYEIQYPPHWFLSEMTDKSKCQGSDILTSYKPSEVQVKDPDFFKGKLKIDMGRFIQTKSESQTLNEWLQNYEKKLETGVTTIISQTPIGLTGRNAIRQVKNYISDKNKIMVNYYIEGESHVYFISAYGDFSQNQEVLDQILSTFKFLGQQADETANWKIYTAEKVVDYFKAFKLHYPSSWELSVDKGTDPDRQSLTLEKEGFTILILQAPGSEASCLYPEDSTQEGMFAKYEEYKEMRKGDNITWRRAMPESQNPNEATYKVCEKTAGSKYFTGATSIGFISLKGQNFDDQILNEFDEILEKIEITD